MKEHIGGDRPMLDAPQDTEGADQLQAKSSLPHDLVEESGRRFGMLVETWHQGGSQRQEIERLLQLGRYLKNLRLERAISIETLAERTGLRPEFVLFLEGGLATSEEVTESLSRVVDGLGLTSLDPSPTPTGHK